MSTTPVERFEKYFAKGSEDECWLWTGGMQGKKYGRFNWAPAANYAHRAAHMFYVGPVAEGMVVLHKCDNPSCVNPKHLLVGTQSDNIRDMMVKGRASFQKDPEKYKEIGRKLGATQKGEHHSKAKLTATDVAAIRRLAKRGAFHIDLAKAFLVSKGTIHGIVMRKKWK